MAWFKQDIATSGAYLPNGRKIALDFVMPDQSGYLATANGYVVTEIRSAISKHNGGWSEVTQGDYDEALKKKANPTPRDKKRLSSEMFQFNPDLKSAVESVAIAAPEPIAVPTPEQLVVPASRARVGRMPR